MNSGSTAMSACNSLCSSILASRVWAAICPIFLSGWRTVVRLGIQNSARTVPSHGHSGQQGRLLQRSINSDEAFYAARDQHLRVILQKPLVMPVSHSEKEIIFLADVLLDAADNHGAVSIADFFQDHSDSVGALHAQGTSHEIGPILQFARRLQDSSTRAIGNRPGSGRI